jgi:hypothetical protein
MTTEQLQAGPSVFDVPNVAAWLRRAADAADEATRSAHDEFRAEVNAVLASWRDTRDPDLLFTLGKIDGELQQLGGPMGYERGTPASNVFRRAACLLDGKGDPT